MKLLLWPVANGCFAGLLTLSLVDQNRAALYCLALFLLTMVGMWYFGRRSK